MTTGDSSPIVIRLKAAEEKITSDSIVSTVMSSDQFTSKYSTAEQTAEKITQAISSTNGQISALEQTVSGIDAAVSDNADNITN